jgi:carbon monoxide dehydrogenase subunit G
MARFVDTVMTSTWSQDEAFSYMADVRNFAEWDPGTERVVQVQGGGSGPIAEYDVTVKMGSRTMTLRYAVTEWDPPHRVVLEASKPWMRLRDEITIDRVDADTLVTYDARITLRGPLQVFDRLLERQFRKVGERGAAGLRQKLAPPRAAASA